MHFFPVKTNTKRNDISGVKFEGINNLIRNNEIVNSGKNFEISNGETNFNKFYSNTLVENFGYFIKENGNGFS